MDLPKRKKSKESGRSLQDHKVENIFTSLSKAENIAGIFTKGSEFISVAIGL